MKPLLIITLFATLICCKTKTEAEKNADQVYERFERNKGSELGSVVSTDAEFVAKSHYDKTKREVAQAWLNEYRAQKAAHAIKSVDGKELSKKRFDSLGGVKELNIQMIGCNDYKSDFALNNSISDSAQLAFIVRYLADINYVNLKSEVRCKTPVKFLVRIYKNEADYKQSESYYIASCYISPNNLEGEVFISSLKEAK